MVKYDMLAIRYQILPICYGCMMTMKNMVTMIIIMMMVAISMWRKESARCSPILWVHISPIDSAWYTIVIVIVAQLSVCNWHWDCDLYFSFFVFCDLLYSRFLWWGPLIASYGFDLNLFCLCMLIVYCAKQILKIFNFFQKQLVTISLFLIHVNSSN